MLFNIPLSIFLIISVSSQTCQNYQNFCDKCNPLTGLCMKCESDIFTPDENGGCMGAKKCSMGKNYCNECDIFGEICERCETGYYPDKNGGCSYTQNCKISYKGECLVCDNDFILLGKESEFKICKSLNIDDFKNCQEINLKKGICWTCEDGYFTNGGDRKCTKVENCYESSYGNCLSCSYGYYLNKKENICEKKAGNLLNCKQSIDGKTCDICDDYSYFDENGLCVDTNYCSESENGKCLKCIANYYLSSHKNICSNEKNCFDAEYDTGFCNVCESDYYLDLEDYKCKTNREDNDFKYCEKVRDNKCTQCINGYKLSKDSKCSKTYKCLEVENGNCILCEDNYYLGLDYKCTNVEHCIYSDRNDNCKECEDNYYYFTLNRTCLEVRDDYQNCRVVLGQYCSECKNNFYLNLLNKTCINNTENGPFYKCIKSDSKHEFCSECEEGYYLGSEDKKCSLIKNCKRSINGNTCIECDDYTCHDLKKGTCVPNDYLEDENIKFYFACNRTDKDGTKCEQCMEGYEVGEDGYCVDVSRCIERKNGECIKCTEEMNDNGYTYCANKVFGCVEALDEECIRCDDLAHLYFCTECSKGYNLTYGGCVNLTEVEEQI